MSNMIKSMLALFVYIVITISIMLHQKSMTNITRSMFNMTPPVNTGGFDITLVSQWPCNTLSSTSATSQK